MDIREFWEVNRVCLERPFSTSKPRAALTLGLDDHWLMEELGFKPTLRYYQDEAYRIEMNREGNRRLEEGIGLRPFGESFSPGPVRLEELLGCRVEVLEGGTPWLEPSLESLEEVEAWVKQSEAWDAAWMEDQLCRSGWSPCPSSGKRTEWSRGPATVASSILGVMLMMDLMIEEEDLADAFFASLMRLYLARFEALETLTGQQITGIAWLDDNCALFNPEFYERFCMPIHRAVMERFASQADSFRFQHSDSDMAHLLPFLAELNLHGVNLGPRIPAQVIREHLPTAVIHGQIAPFTLRNGTKAEIEAEVIRDFQAVGADGGLVITTAGSVPAGTSIERMRFLMEMVEAHCAYSSSS